MMSSECEMLTHTGIYGDVQTIVVGGVRDWYWTQFILSYEHVIWYDKSDSHLQA